MINRETEFAKAGKKSFIKAKMNSLCDPGIIASLYKASAAGVKIDLVIRGICCLKTGIKGISDNITVRSIVGDFLEHSRIFYFHNNGFEEVYMGSADWMPRNLDKRVEILFPVEDETLKEEIIHILDIQFADNVKARVMQSDGTYIIPPRKIGQKNYVHSSISAKKPSQMLMKKNINAVQHTIQVLNRCSILTTKKNKKLH